MPRSLGLAILAAALLVDGADGQETAGLTTRGRWVAFDLAAQAEPSPAVPLPVGVHPAAAGAIDAGTAARLAGGGILGGAIGFFGGAYLGAWIADRRGSGIDDLNVVRGMLVGATLGEGFLLPAGVHVANGARGSYGKSALVSLGLAVVGVGLMEATHWDPPAAPAIAVAVPIAQLATSIAIERATD